MKDSFTFFSEVDSFLTGGVPESSGCTFDLLQNVT